MRRLLLLTLALLGGCSDPAWQTKDVSGLMPPLEFTLTSEDGRRVSAADYRGEVLLLFFGYTHCPDVCPMTLAHLAAALAELGEPAQRLRVLFVSVDPERDTPELLRRYTAAFGEPFVGLTGTQTELRALTKRYRVTYGYGERDDSGNYLVSHSGAVFAFDTEGRARLLIRDQDPPAAIAADLRRLLDL